MTYNTLMEELGYKKDCVFWSVCKESVHGDITLFLLSSKEEAEVACKKLRKIHDERYFVDNCSELTLFRKKEDKKEEEK